METRWKKEGSTSEWQEQEVYCEEVMEQAAVYAFWVYRACSAFASLSSSQAYLQSVLKGGQSEES